MKRTKLKAIPQSNATTAWGLLVDVKRAITEEPKRVNMNTYRYKLSPVDGGPACGTVGCFAGWVGTMHSPAEYPSANMAVRILGVGLNYEFGRAGYSVFNSGRGDSCHTTKPGTRAHARAVVQRINRFMKCNEAMLKARQLERVSVEAK